MKRKKITGPHLFPVQQLKMKQPCKYFHSYVSKSSRRTYNLPHWLKLSFESMKRPTKPILHPRFKSPTLSSAFTNGDPRLSLYTLLPDFLSIPSNQRLTLDHYHNQNNDFIDKSFLDPSKQQKPITEIASFGQNFSPKAKSLAFRTNFHAANISCEELLKNESFPKPFLKGSKKAKPMSKTIFFDPMLRQFSQKRVFSAAPSDQSCRPVASSDANSANSVPVKPTLNSPVESSSPIDAGGSMRKPISLWPGMYHSPVTNALWEARSSIFERLSNVPADAPPQSELIAKPPSKSRTSIVYKFSTDYILREQYRNPWNEIRMGKLLEDLDALAGTISFKHCSSDDSTARPLLLVTASVDKIVLKKPISVDTDLRIEGAVTWVGRSSMEILLEVTQSAEEKFDPSESLALTAIFTFVARESKTGKSAPINQISPETEKERLLWEEALERNEMRKKKRGEQKRDIDNEEVNRLDELLAEGRIFCDMPALADRDSILIRDTCLQNSLICQPQQRNIHGRIFGGFLMRRAFELAYATAYTFAGSAPCFLEVDHVDFLKPVDVGNFLRFKSCVLYTELENPAQPLINVEVVAHVTRPELRCSAVSNKFYFTFTVRSDAMKNGAKIRNVVPATEEEARRVIERMDAEKS